MELMYFNKNQVLLFTIKKYSYRTSEAKLINNNEMLYKNIIDIRYEIMIYITEYLMGVATRKMRGITLNHNEGFLDINVYFDSVLTEEEEDEMLHIDTYLLSERYPKLYNRKGEVISNIDNVGLNLISISSDIDV